MAALALKGRLTEAGLTTLQVAHALHYAPSTLSIALNHGKLPKRRDFRGEVEGYLKGRGVPTDGIWEEVAASSQGYRPEPTLQDVGSEPERTMLAQSTLKYFRLFRDPFDEPLSPEDVYLSPGVRFILEAMRHAVRTHDIVAIIGDSGSGKSVARRLLVSELARNQEVAVICPRLLDKGAITPSTLADAVIADISGESPRRSPEAKARQVERLLGGGPSGTRNVILIEEAHELSIQALKLLKRFWEFGDNGGFGRSVGIILIGQTELRYKLDERRYPEAREFIRRCTQVEVEPLGNDLAGYIAFRFKRAGGDLERVLAPGAVDALRRRLTYIRRNAGPAVSMALPLAVNNLLARAMNTAESLGLERVTAELVEEM